MSDVDSKPLNPLRMILGINADTRLNPGERVALTGAVAHTDNATRKVCFSQKALAEEFGLGRGTVKNAYRKAMELGYFSHKRPWRNDKGQMMTDYFFKSLPPVATLGPTANPVVTLGPTAKSVVDPVVDPVVTVRAPSTTSTSSTTNASQHPDADKAPVHLWSDEKAQDSASLRDAPHVAAVPEIEATEEESVESEMCELHTSFAKEACDYCARPKVESKLSEAKQRQLFEQNQRQNEDPRALGIFEDEVPRASGYTSRRRSA